MYSYKLKYTWSILFYGLYKKKGLFVCAKRLGQLMEA